MDWLSTLFEKLTARYAVSSVLVSVLLIAALPGAIDDFQVIFAIITLVVVFHLFLLLVINIARKGKDEDQL